jgi:hypothetical protein
MDKKVREYLEKYGETVESTGEIPNIDFRAMIKEVERLGRPLTLKEMEKFERKSKK